MRELRERLLSGAPFMLFDFPGREEEVDLVYYAPAVTAASVYNLRTLAGGLICFATTEEVGSALGLEKAWKTLSKQGYSKLVKKPKYGDYPAFSVWVNHVDVRTGISDEDRALTIRKLAEVAELALSDPEEAKRRFEEEFYAPGHVPVLLASKLEERRGHTELSVRLLEALRLTPAAAFAEMLDYGRSMSLRRAEELSRSLGIPLIKGEEVLAFLGMRSDSNVER
ncbi:3,4-dihydroxy-2-butanone-4-phosphate synthase [Ignicoccus hospitalis]|uniref:3,4-dihydroxy-2-butanone 4-phosphate synthase n=1 Tax=Ignicoccus hospitalis (strain KIN4/I / DSM 18386 / JCM 14125) TaxID=453591 RepID=A8A9K2_IGNH4|nr:3,4-dihydroxy-2-butanone-4-phosphate synthase [Ignicoccus hospitalis]ABU81604.1 3,4-dihydroxy-2-butanone 4-phosphate synthase [Ignicoccus hospitalis KIN4/I]HIH90200.1 3,4-dihydroxy-2-butanone 4-phosphate synthase [Desulfurococcaceae archaeon]